MTIQLKTKLRSTSSLIDLTPLVDVIFLLLIFFIVTSDILPLKALNVDNPRLTRDSPALSTQVLLIVDAHNVLYLGHQKEIIDMPSLSQKLEAEIERVRREHPGADPTVVLSADKSVDYGTFLRVFSATQECGHRIRLVYKPAVDELASWR